MNELIGRLEEVFRRVAELSRRLHFDRRNQQQIHAACLHALLLERMAACLLLLKHGHNAAVPGVLRDLFEVYVDLVNLACCPEYVVRLRATSLIQRQAVGTTFGAADAATLAELERHGLGGLDTRERFERAGLATLYDSLHALLTRYAHHDVAPLADRLLTEVDGSYQLRAVSACEREALLPFLHMLAGVAVDSYRRLAQLAQRQDAQGLAQVAEALKRYMNSAARAQAA